MLRLTQRTGLLLADTCFRNLRLRHFHCSRAVWKDEKSKQMLKDLSLNLQKGNINESEDEKNPEKKVDLEEKKQQKQGGGKEKKQRQERELESTQKARQEGECEGELELESTQKARQEGECELELESTQKARQEDEGELESAQKARQEGEREQIQEQTQGQESELEKTQKQELESAAPVQERDLFKESTSKKKSNPIQQQKKKQQQRQKQQKHIMQLQQQQQQFIQQYIKEMSESLHQMSLEDLIFQIGLDGDGPFMSLENPHFVNSKKILCSIPDSLDLFNPKDMAKVDEIYAKLNKLDSNPQMHQKFLKRFFFDYNNDLILLSQHLRGISSKFKQLRRNETDKFKPESTIYELIHDKMKYAYNVVGFDRSCLGMPLRSNMETGVYPREFIQDLPHFDHKIHLKKTDFNFAEKDACINVDPNKVTPLKDLYDYENRDFNRHDEYNNDDDDDEGSRRGKGGGVYSTLETKTGVKYTHKATHQYLSDNLGLPRQYIPIKNCYSYRRLKLNNHQITNRIEQEIRIMKKLLTDEIKATIESSNIVLMSTNQTFHQDAIKSNQYILCEIKDKLPGTIFIWKSFSILPLYFILPLTKRRERTLITHLYKLFLINLEDYINILFKIKYDHTRDVTKFMKTLLKNIGHTIQFRLWRYFKINKRTISSSAAAAAAISSLNSSISLPLLKSKYKQKQAVVYSPFTDSCFKRIYWIKRGQSEGDERQLRRGAKKVDFAVIGEDLIE
ncbi:hypothetical protein KGF56_003934 [Candida oxycetoniae]|uniref:Uncharacterized protein n=1 Tax=Candida oxycetoniae TaxID=497107 RepID=A0AAI9SUX7_9ASCO|nr:uncharacterized protein KGF56_003934 [Candida oxycetoniae]KAI3403346.2 hypothetical protein KGF56_003934 [Candida oxycetoniae]